jgi:hypothetical protein
MYPALEKNSLKHSFSDIYNDDGKVGMPEGYLAGGANMYNGSWFSRFAGKCYNDIKTEWTSNKHTIYWNSGLVFSAALDQEITRLMLLVVFKANVSSLPGRLLSGRLFFEGMICK